MIYEKSGIAVKVADKFIYSSQVYLIWKNGASLWEDKWYSSDNPIKIKKKDLKLKKKNYTLHRFFQLECAPEEYLINQGYEKRY